MNHYLDQRGEPRVVITGMGALTPIGQSVDSSWENLLAGNSGIGRITLFDSSPMSCQIAGEVDHFNPKDYIPSKEIRRMSRGTQLGVAAAKQALDDADLFNDQLDRERIGIIMGTGMGGLDLADKGLLHLRRNNLDWSKANPFNMLGSLPNIISHHVSLMAQIYGPINTIVAACSTGTQTIGDSFDYIRRGRADIMIAGGAEGMIHEGPFAGFCAMRALATSYNDDPTRASRPFDKNREGFIMSEGAATVVLERLDHAIGRGAKIYAEVIGHSNSAESYHVASPNPAGSGRIRAMRWALEDAKLPLDAVDYISAHGTSTPLNDSIETLAIKKLFGAQAYQTPISSIKALTGHTLGAAGTVEAIMAIKTLQTGIMPPTWNYETPDPECDLDYIPNEPREKNVTHILSNSFGLGGQNACLVLKKYPNS